MNQQNAAYPFITAKTQSLGSFNSCSENVKKLLKGPWGSIFLPNKNFTFVQYCAFTLIIYPLEIILCS